MGNIKYTEQNAYGNILAKPANLDEVIELTIGDLLKMIDCKFITPDTARILKSRNTFESVARSCF